MLLIRILVALDGSEPSSDTSSHLTDLVKRFPVILIAIHATDSKYRNLETDLSVSTGRFDEILMLADNAKQNASVS